VGKIGMVENKNKILDAIGNCDENFWCSENLSVVVKKDRKSTQWGNWARQKITGRLGAKQKILA
jgi:hypothetical protein